MVQIAQGLLRLPGGRDRDEWAGSTVAIEGTFRIEAAA